MFSPTNTLQQPAPQSLIFKSKKRSLKPVSFKRKSPENGRIDPDNLPSSQLQNFVTSPTALDHRPLEETNENDDDDYDNDQRPTFNQVDESEASSDHNIVDSDQDNKDTE